MAPQLAATRLRKELINLKKDPPPGLIAEPNESDILVWHYAIRGPLETPYEGGIYIGKIKFPSEYPLKAPSIYMLTPSGRFQCNTKICMSMSDFHPESWNPMWSVATIIQGVQSFMTSEEGTTGALKASEADRKKFASVSMAYNQKTFPQLFGGDLDEAFAEAEEARKEAEKNKTIDGGCTTRRSNRRNRRKKGEEEVKNEEEEGDDNDDDQEGGEQKEQGNELTLEEIENRRKKNAKKRAKQKAKKAAAKDEGEQATGVDNDMNKLAIDDEQD
jgi:ubiquitin-conjugating enzyme E2 J2